MTNAVLSQPEIRLGARRKPIREPRLGAQAHWALSQQLRSRRKRKILVLVAAYADAGIADPSIRELATRSEIPAVRVVSIVDALAASGWFRIERASEHDAPNHYVINPSRRHRR